MLERNRVGDRPRQNNPCKIAKSYALSPFLNKRDPTFHEDLTKTLKFRPPFFENRNMFIHSPWLYYFLPKVRDHET